MANGKVYLTDRIASPTAAAQRGRIEGVERVLCIDAATGEEIWKHDYDCTYGIAYAAGPRATPVVDDGKVYTLGAEGNLFCFDGETGRILWAVDFNEMFGVKSPMWGFAAHPLIDGNKLICLPGGEGSTAVAFDKNTGKELWRALSAKEPGYAPPVIFEINGKRQLIVWHPEAVNGLDPETGKVFWSEDWKIQNALTIATPRLWRGNQLYFASFYNGSRMLKLNDDSSDASVVWQSTKVSEKDTSALHCLMSTPSIDEGMIYGICGYGQLRGLDAKTGDRLWESLAPTTSNGKPARWANAFLVKNGERYFIANEKGELIIAELSRDGYKEISRAKLLEPTGKAAGRDLVWSHPAFANKSIYLRNDKELVCADLAK